MADLFRKLSILLRAGVNDAMNAERGERVAPPPQTPQQAGANLDKEVATLRTSIDDALAYEDKLSAQIAQHDADIRLWSAEADAALARGDDEKARVLVGQTNRGEAYLVRLQQDLQAHRQAAGELIDRVNEMESIITQARTTSLPETIIAGDENPATDTIPTAQDDLDKRRSRLTKKD
mgnify:CR=1 FL=1